MKHIYICYPQGKFKAITFSYDDGKIMDRRLVKLFNKYNVKATFHLNSDMFSQSIGHTYPYIDESEINKLYSGHEIASHSCSHPTLSRIPLSMAMENVLEDRKVLEKITGKLVRGFSYPNGVYNTDIKNILKLSGLVYARTTKSTYKYNLPEDYLEWHPTCHHNDPKLDELSSYFLKTQYDQRLNLLYVWGHSYEFERDQNWDQMEEFLKKISNNEQVWYATNIEIYEYMKACNELIYTADGTCVYNPTQTDIWLSVDGEAVEVKRGMKVCLIK